MPTGSPQAAGGARNLAQVTDRDESVAPGPDRPPSDHGTPPKRRPDNTLPSAADTPPMAWPALHPPDGKSYARQTHFVSHRGRPNRIVPPGGHRPSPTLPAPSFVSRSDLDHPGPGLPAAPSQGWRRLLYRATGGQLNPGPSEKQARRDDLERRARTVLRGNYRIGVVGKGGVGKTTVAAAVGSVLADLRRQDGVVAVDADTAFGKIGSRIDPLAVDSYWELVTDQRLDTFTDMRGRLGANTSGLFVLPGANQRHPLDVDLYREAVARLDRYFAITIVDCGATMDTPVTRAVAVDLDAAIVVTTPWADGAHIAQQSLHWLAAHGAPDLLRRTIVVLNDSDGNSDKSNHAAIAERFIRTGIPVFDVPFDERLRPGGVLDIHRGMAPGTHYRFLEMAAAIASSFGDNSRRHRPPPLR